MYILIDIGGTKTRVAVTEHREAFLEPVVFPTPQDFNEWFILLKDTAKTLLQGRKVNGLVAGLPGTFTDEGVIIVTPNLVHWENVSLQQHLSDYFSCSTSKE